MTAADDAIRDAIQSRVLDAAGDGWTLGQYVVCMGLQRLDPDGRVESIAWCWAPDGQPDWQSLGLLECGQDLLVSPTVMEDGD